MLEPLRAPKRYCAASPPEPWQAGMAPNQQPSRFIPATERPRDVTEGAAGWGGEGKRSDARAAAAITELRRVRGSWPSEAVVAASQKVDAGGSRIGIVGPIGTGGVR
jgi:hypothetical protein